MKSAKDALSWLILMKEELGRDWLEPELFRLGASSMLGDIERQIEHFVTGRYSSTMRHAMA
jgi:deoxyribose-phosphate aldolase